MKKRQVEIENTSGNYVYSEISLENEKIYKQFQDELFDSLDYTLPWPPTKGQIFSWWNQVLADSALNFHQKGEEAELHLIRKLSKHARRSKSYNIPSDNIPNNPDIYGILTLGRKNDIEANIFASVKGAPIHSGLVNSVDGTTLDNLRSISFSRASIHVVYKKIYRATTFVLQYLFGFQPSETLTMIETQIKKKLTLPWYMPAYSEPYSAPIFNNKHIEEISNELLRQCASDGYLKVAKKFISWAAQQLCD